MKLVAALARSLQADMQVELRNIERAVTTGTREAGRGLTAEPMAAETAMVVAGSGPPAAAGGGATAPASTQRPPWPTLQPSARP